MNEDLEIARAEATKKVLASLTEMVEDKTKQTAERLEAGSLVRGICQDLILGDLSSRSISDEGDFKKKLLKQADKLDQREP